MDPVEALERIAFLLERQGAVTYRVQAFRTAATVVGTLSPDEARRRALDGSLGRVKGLGPKTTRVVEEALAGVRPAYLSHLTEEAGGPLVEGSRGSGFDGRCAVTAICTRTGRTAAARSRPWPAPPVTSGTPGVC